MPDNEFPRGSNEWYLREARILYEDDDHEFDDEPSPIVKFLGECVSRWAAAVDFDEDINGGDAAFGRPDASLRWGFGFGAIHPGVR